MATEIRLRIETRRMGIVKIESVKLNANETDNGNGSGKEIGIGIEIEMAIRIVIEKGSERESDAIGTEESRQLCLDLTGVPRSGELMRGLIREGTGIETLGIRDPTREIDPGVRFKVRHFSALL